MTRIWDPEMTANVHRTVNHVDWSRGTLNDQADKAERAESAQAESNRPRGLTMQNRDETLIWAWSLSSPIISRASHLRGIPIRREVENEKLTKFEKNWIRGATKHKTRAKGSLRDVGDRLGQGYGLRFRRPVTMMCLANRVCISNAATSNLTWIWNMCRYFFNFLIADKHLRANYTYCI